MPDERYTFETARVRLEEIAAEVRKKDTSLEKSLDLLEEGVRLANICTELVDHTDLSATVTQSVPEAAGSEPGPADDETAAAGSEPGPADDEADAEPGTTGDDAEPGPADDDVEPGPADDTTVDEDTVAGDGPVDDGGPGSAEAGSADEATEGDPPTDGTSAADDEGPAFDEWDEDLHEPGGVGDGD